MFEEKSRNDNIETGMFFTLQYSLALKLIMKFNVFQFLGFPRHILASCYAICLAFLLENGFMARARKKLTASSKLRREILVWSSTYLQHVTLLAELKQNQESIIIIQLFTFMNME